MPFLRIFQEDPNAKPLRFLDFKPGQPAFTYEDFARRRGLIYVMECAGFHKIGITNRTTADARLKQVQAANPFPVRLVAYRTVPLAGLSYGEAYMHHHFRERRVHGEWFSVSFDEIQPVLVKAVLRAQAYARHCREWDMQDRVRAINRNIRDNVPESEELTP